MVTITRLNRKHFSSLEETKRILREHLGVDEEREVLVKVPYFTCTVHDEHWLIVDNIGAEKKKNYEGWVERCEPYTARRRGFDTIDELAEWVFEEIRWREERKKKEEEKERMKRK